MKKLIELRILLLISMTLAIFCTVTTVQTATAGSYVEQDPDFNGGGMEEPDSQSGSGWSSYTDATYSASSSSISCHAEANGDMTESHTSSLGPSSWAYKELSWEWEGGGTPTGGTLSWSTSISGDADIYGSSSASYPFQYDATSCASASSYGSSSYGPSGSGSASGSSHENEEGSYDWSGDDGDGYASYGYYSAESEWSVSESDDEELSVGTTSFSFYESVGCSVSVYLQLIEIIGSGYVSADAESNASGYGSASFSSN